MSYLERYKWELIPKTLPTVIRNCPRCNEKTHYVNTKKFRINANKGSIDIWLIYQCPHCKSTWNMTLYERINQKDLSPEEYIKFQENDQDSVMKYAFDFQAYRKNKADYVLKDIEYEVVKSRQEVIEYPQDKTIIEFFSKYPTDLRVDRFLSEQLSIPRSRIKKLMQNKQIICPDRKNLSKQRIENGLLICIIGNLNLDDECDILLKYNS